MENIFEIYILQFRRAKQGTVIFGGKILKSLNPEYE